MNRRSLLRIFGLGGAAAVGETMPGIGRVWIYNRSLPIMPPQGQMAGFAAMGAGDTANAVAEGRAFAAAREGYSLIARQERILREAAAIEAEREYAMTDWGGAL